MTTMATMPNPAATPGSPITDATSQNAHPRYFSEPEFKKLKGNNKKLMIVPGANHTDLYGNTDKIPFDTIEEFFTKYLVA